MLIEEEYYNRYTRNCIYLATCLVNNKIYAGKTERTLNERISAHHKDYKKKNIIWYNAIKKYGFNSILWQIIYAMPNQGELTPEEKVELNNKEIEYIKLYNSTDINIGYNRTYGGTGGKPTEETRQKLRDLAARKNANPDYHRVLRESMQKYYKNLTEEDKLKRYPKKEKPPKENKMKQRKDVDLIVKTNKKPNKTKHTLEQIELTKTALSEGKTNAEIIRKYHIPRSLISDIKYHGYHATIRPDLNFAIYGKEPTVIEYVSTEDIKNVKRIIDDDGTPKDIERELGVDKIKLYKQIKYQGMYKDV